MGESISVSAFLEILNETLGFAYPQVVVQGEISEYKVSQNKFVYFKLKDDQATLPCFMMIFHQKMPLEDGMTVRVTGSPKIMTKRGDFSFTVRQVELAGVGELKRALELLKAKLSAEGLFDPARKRSLPPFPRRIGLVTSVKSAAYEDFMKIVGQRWGALDITAVDVAVQGAQAPDSVVAALNHLNQMPERLDVIVLIRGGGSLEDLAAFSTEPVVRAVAASRTPIVVGVGHEIDTSLADLAADLRAATPTDAARLVVPDRREVLDRIVHRQAAVQHRLERRLAAASYQIDRSRHLLLRFIERPRRSIDRAEHQIIQAYRSALEQNRQRVELLSRLLAGLDPKAVLKRGYAIVRQGQAVLRRAADAKPGDHLMIQLAQGRIGARVDEDS